LVLLVATAAAAQDAAFTVPVSVQERARVKGCGRSIQDVDVRLDVPGDGSWVLEGPTETLQGQLEAKGRRGTKLLLTPDAPALGALSARVEAAATRTCAAPRTVGSVTVRRFLAKLNRRGTKVRLGLKVLATLEDGKRVVLSWRGVGLTESVGATTTTTTTTTTPGATSTSTTLACGAIDLGSTSPQTIASTTSGAGNDAAPADTCFAFGVTPANGEDVLYSWTAPSDGTFTFDTLSPGIDTVLYVEPGCGGAELVCNDDFAQNNSGSYVGLEMTAGEQILIVVDSYAASGAFTLQIRGPVAEGNCCAQRSTGSCETPDVASCVCENDSYCCDTAWDQSCVVDAMLICSAQCD
jgi:hypothetical protein